MRDSVIIDGLRSPIGINKGNLRGIRPDDLSSHIVKKLLSKNNSIEPSIYEDLVMGCAFPEGSQGGLMAKGVAVLSDLPETIAAKVVNRFCGSSMDAVHQVSQSIISGDSNAGIACGVEHMFNLENERYPGFGVPMMGYNPSLNPSLIEKEYYIDMGATAENLAFVMQGSASLAILRMLSAVPAHFVFAVIMGYYLGKAKTEKKNKVLYLILSLLIPIIFHAFYGI